MSDYRSLMIELEYPLFGTCTMYHQDQISLITILKCYDILLTDLYN